MSLVPTAPSPGSGTHRDIHGPVTSPDPEGHTIASNRTRLLAATATALVLAGVGAQAASASSAHYESHTYQVRTHRVIDVECNYGETYLNFTTTADPAKSQVVETGLIFEHHQTVGMTLNVKGPITFTISLLCQ